MAYGVIMGQTPILSASGIEYDNSQTASVITGNNVQDAIDQTVGKVKDIEANALWKIKFVKEFKFNGSVYYPGSVGTKDIMNLDMPREAMDNSLALIFVLSGTVSTDDTNNSYKLEFAFGGGLGTFYCSDSFYTNTKPNPPRSFNITGFLTKSVDYIKENRLYKRKSKLQILI